MSQKRLVDSIGETEFIIPDVLNEYHRATSRYPTFCSAHEGFAVLLEEVDELKAEVWKNGSTRDLSKMRKEAIQVAAMAVRFIHDCCNQKYVRLAKCE